MSQQEKAGYFRALKDAGVQFDRHYREYTTAELKEAYDKLETAQPTAGAAPEPQFDAAATAAALAAAMQPQTPEVTRQPPTRFESMAQHPSAATRPSLPVRGPDPNEIAGQRLNVQDEDEPIRVDELGRVWYQEEVLKPAFPKPRARRVLQYMDSGAVTKTVKNGEYMESFEVPGDPANARPAEVKITMPSYQVGIYRDPRFPFRVVTYNGNEGFDLFDVQKYYGGSELVPTSVKRKYVENVLCYDIRTTVRAIEAEYRQLQLSGKA